MSQNIQQIFVANPASSMVSTDLLYLGRSPYDTTDDFAITFANFVASIGTATPTASTIARWDAHINLSANNFIGAFATTATAAATTTLTVSSAYNQYFTGSTTQTVVMPVTSTLALGQSWLIVNNSSGAVTVESSGANTIQVMAAGTSMLITCISLSGTTAASWQVVSYGGSGATYPLAVALGGTGVTSVTIAPTATSWAGWDANSNLSANNFMSAYTTTATAASTTALTIASTYFQFWTGTTTQTVTLPHTGTVLGTSYYFVNNSTGAVTVQSSGANTIQAMAANSSCLFTCVTAGGTTAASWNAQYFVDADVSGAVLIANLGTGVYTALQVNVGTSGCFVVNGGALGTPSSGTLSSCTGYAQSALTGLGTGVSTALGNNLNAVSGLPSIVADTTWTPVFTSDGGGTATYSSQSGIYTRLGPLVFFELTLVLSGLPNAGNVSITGLPVNVGPSFSSAMVFANFLNASVVTPLTATCTASASSIVLYTFATGSTTTLTVGGCTSSSQFIISGFYHT